MTIIAFDGKILASDTLMVSNNYKFFDKESKIVIRDNIVYAHAGTCCLFKPMVQWYESGRDADKYPKIGEDSSILIVFDPNVVFPSVAVYDASPYPDNQRIGAWGSGSAAAFGAFYCMDVLGVERSAIVAVKTAIAAHTTCGGHLEYVNVENPNRIYLMTA